MNYRKVENLEAAAQFLYEANQIKSTHVGVLPRDEQKIYQLLSSVSNGNLYEIIEDDNLVAILGTMDNGQVIGPVSKSTTENTFKLMHAIWQEIVTNNKSIESYNFHIDAAHEFGQYIMKSIHTEYLGTEYTMRATEVRTDIETNQVVPYDRIYRKSFIALLKNLFVDYKTRAEKVISQIDERDKLYILMSEGIAKGYIQLEVNENATCYIDYVATHKNYRHQGIGHQLVAYAARHAFTEHGAKSVELKVKDKRKSSIMLYEKIGFLKVGELLHFKFDTKYHEVNEHKH